MNIFLKRILQRVVNLLRMINPREDVAIVAELLTTQQRLTARFEQRLEHVERLLAGEQSGAGLAPDLRILVGTTLERLSDGSAQFLNWATGHTGYAAQAGLWFNPSLYVEHRAGTVVLAEMNERVVEIPYAMSAVTDREIGAKVVDVGATESTLAISLASLGYDVTAIDPRPYPFRHPRLKAVTTPVEHWAPEDSSIDVITCISTIEHIGVGAYGQGKEDEETDRRIMALFSGWLKPGGTLVLTVPYGQWSVTDFQRTYDNAHLSSLLDGWIIEDQRLCVRTSPLVWEVHAGQLPSDARGVALVKATPA